MDIAAAMDIPVAAPRNPPRPVRPPARYQGYDMTSCKKRRVGGSAPPHTVDRYKLGTHTLEGPLPVRLQAHARTHPRLPSELQCV